MPSYSLGGVFFPQSTNRDCNNITIGTDTTYGSSTPNAVTGGTGSMLSIGNIQAKFQFTELDGNIYIRGYDGGSGTWSSWKQV